MAGGLGRRFAAALLPRLFGTKLANFKLPVFPGRVPQGQQAGHSERTCASGAGRFLVTLYITIYAVRILITLFKT